MKKVSSSDQPATSADIQRIETSLKNFATKDDLKRFATKDDLKKYSTKTDLKRVEKSLRGEILRVEERVEQTEEKLDKKLDTYHSQIMSRFDELAQELENSRLDRVLGVDYAKSLENIKHHILD